jgi:hypothetical protein
MTTKQLGMDLVSEDGKKYHARIEQQGDSPDLTFRLFRDEGPLMHVTEFPAEFFTNADATRRPFAAKTGVMFSVEAFGVMKSWIRMIWEMTR